MCKSNFVLVVGFVGFPSQAPGIALVKYEMTGEAEEADNPNGSYGDSIQCVIEIFAEQLIVAEEKPIVPVAILSVATMCAIIAHPLFDATNAPAALEQMPVASLHNSDGLFSIAFFAKVNLTMRVIVDIVNYLKSWTDSVTK